MLKTFVLVHIFVKTVRRIFQDWTVSSKEQHLFEIEIFCYIINGFTVTLDQFNASSQNKIINFFKKKKSYGPLLMHNIRACVSKLTGLLVEVCGLKRQRCDEGGVVLQLDGSSNGD